MAQAKGVMGQLLLCEIPESAYGVAPSSVYSVKLPFNSCGLTATRNMIDPGTIVGRRDPSAPIQGRINASGPVVVPVDKTAIGYWLELVFGNAVTTWTGSAKQHVFKPNSVLNSYQTEKGFTDIGQYEKFTGIKANGMSIKVGGDEEVAMSVDLVGKEAVPNTSSAFASPTTLVLTRFTQYDAQLQEGGAAIDGKVRELEIKVANNLDEGGFLISSGTGAATRGIMNEGFCQVTGRLSMMFENASYYLRALSGTERSLQLDFRSGSFALQFRVPELIFERFSPGIESPEGIWADLPFRGYFSAGSEAVIQATLINTYAAYSGHAA